MHGSSHLYQVGLGILVLLSCGSAHAQDTAQTPPAITEVIKTVERSVVQIAVETERGGRSGTGFMVGPGLIATNFHVIDEALRISVTLGEESARCRETVFVDERRDLAILKVPELQAPALPLRTTPLEKGEPLVVLGHPAGWTASISRGVVSAVRSSDEVNKNLGRDVYAGEWIQTDATINRGNSGGPVFDLTGRVVGAATWMFIHNGATGLNFAISAKDIAYALEHPSPAPIREVQAKSNPVRAVPLYWIQRTVSGRTASMILTRKIEEYTEVLRGNTSSDIRTGLGILGSVFPHEVPDSKRLFRYIDSRQPGASQHRYSTRDIKLKDLPRGVLRDTSYPETWVLTQSGDGRFPVYRTSLVAGGQRRERGATRPRPNVATVDIFSREYNHRVHTKEFDTVQGSGIFGKTGIAFYVRAHASILHPIYAVSRQAGGQTTYYYTSKIESLTEQMSANKPGDIREFQGLLGFAFPYPEEGTARLYTYRDTRRGEGRYRLFQYSTKYIPPDLAPRNVRYLETGERLWVFMQPLSSLHPIYRVIHKDGFRAKFTASEEDYLTLRRQWESPASSLFGDTGVNFYLVRPTGDE